MTNHCPESRRLCAAALFVRICLLLSLTALAPAASARIEQELCSTRAQATAAAKRMGAGAVISYDFDLQQYVVTLGDAPRHTARHQPRHKLRHAHPKTPA